MALSSIKEPMLAPTSEDYIKLLHHSYYIVSEAYQKMVFFKGQNLKASSTLVFLDLLKNWEHPVACEKYNNTKKGRPANNLLLLESDSSWKNQSIIKHEGKIYKAFMDWGEFATHVSDLLTFRPSYFAKYDYSNLENLCYDIDINLMEQEYWRQIQKNQNQS